MATEEKLYKLYKSYKTVLEMLHDRGYKDAVTHYLTCEEFYNKFVDDRDEIIEKDIKNEMTLTFAKNNEDKIKVYWYPDPKLGTEFRNIVKELEEENITKAIIIIEVSITPVAKDILRKLRTQKIYIDVFSLNATQINITHNRLVPRHTVCSREKKNEIMKVYSVNRNQLPSIKTSDPVVRYLGALKGQLIKIERESEVMKDEKIISYRLVD